MTVYTLLEACKRQVKLGNGDKFIYISSDEEGNYFHPLIYDFEENIETIKEFSDMGMIEEGLSSTEKMILLG